MIAKDVDELHGTNNLTKETALNERGEIVKGRGDQPNMHDMLTGTQPDWALTGATELEVTDESAGERIRRHHREAFAQVHGG